MANYTSKTLRALADAMERKSYVVNIENLVLSDLAQILGQYGATVRAHADAWELAAIVSRYRDGRPLVDAHALQEKMMLDRLDDPTCPHKNTVEEVRDTRRLVNGEMSGDIEFEITCTDCGKVQDHPFAHAVLPSLKGGMDTDQGGPYDD